MKLYNTLSRRKEEFVPITPGKVLMYACGPTVYNYFHIGNARPFITFDVLRRYLEYRGYKVKFVQNFTDIDDKMIRRAEEEKTSLAALGDHYIEEYFTDAQGLGVGKATVHPRATHCIGDIIQIIEKLIEKGYAYPSGGDVFFSTKKFKDYGKLSHLPIDQLESGARIDVNDLKEDPMDFAVWKAAKPGEPSWPSPWGEGRPGWHIECSAMACKFLGKTIDIHCGGVDLIFPHHENEIAQSEAANGCSFAHYWLHNGHINVDHHKMSKSAGNFFTVRDAAQKYGYEAIRMFMLSSHYRSPINFSADILESAKASLQRLYTTRNNLEYAIKTASGGKTPEEEALLAELPSFRERFLERMDDDLNTADALSVIFDLARWINTRLAETHSLPFLSALSDLFSELTGVLNLVGGEQTAEIPAEIQALADERSAARAAKDFARADAIRNQLAAMGVLLEDGKDGVKILMKQPEE